MPVEWPSPLPGAYFVIVWDRELLRFELQTDDEEASTYNLGADISKIMTWLRRVGMLEIGSRALDQAREFGAAQAIPAQGRVVNLKEKLDTTRKLFEKEEENLDVQNFCQLP